MGYRENIAKIRGWLNNVPENQRDARWEAANGKLSALEIMADSAPGQAALGAAELLNDVQDELADVIPDIANATLDVVRGLGGAIVDGLDGAYDAAAAKLKGREPDVVAGIVVVSLTILTGLYLFHSAKAARDAF